MGAERPFIVKVLRLIEDEVEVYAITEEEAMHEAEQIPGIAKAMEATWEAE